MEMDEKLNAALLNVLAMLRPNVPHDDAVKFSQAALNLAHVKQILEQAPKKRASA
jgi:hypothetical protein